MLALVVRSIVREEKKNEGKEREGPAVMMPLIQYKFVVLRRGRVFGKRNRERLGSWGF